MAIRTGQDSRNHSRVTNSIMSVALSYNSYIVREMPALPGLHQASFYMIFPKPCYNVVFPLHVKNSEEFFQ